MLFNIPVCCVVAPPRVPACWTSTEEWPQSAVATASGTSSQSNWPINQIPGPDRKSDILQDQREDAFVFLSIQTDSFCYRAFDNFWKLQVAKKTYPMTYPHKILQNLKSLVENSMEVSMTGPMHWPSHRIFGGTSPGLLAPSKKVEDQF